MNNKKPKTSKTFRSEGMFCPCCLGYFPSLKTKDQLIDIHMMNDDACWSYVIQCPNRLCHERFLSNRGLSLHLSRSSVCQQATNRVVMENSFASSAAASFCTSSRNTHESGTKTKSNCSTSVTSKQEKGPRPKKTPAKTNSKNVHMVDTQTNRKETGCINVEDDFAYECDISESNRSLLYDVPDSFLSRNPNKKDDSAKNKCQPLEDYNKTSDPSCQLVQDPSCKNVSIPSMLSASTRRDMTIAMTPQYHTDSDSSYSFSNASTVSFSCDSVDMDDLSDLEDESSTQDKLMKLRERSPEYDNNDLRLNDAEFEDAINLLYLLMKKKISLHRYDDLMKWKHGNSVQYPSLQCVIQSATRRIYGKHLSKKMEPIVTLVQLPSKRGAAPLVKFRVDAMIYDLLSDSNLTKEGNMIFERDGRNPFNISSSEYYGDFDTSTYYTETMKSLNLDTTKQVLCPIVLYVDEVKLDSYGKLGLEPIVMSLLIYNRKTRNLSKAWRVIGYMPNFTSMFGKRSYTPDDRANDYHFCLNKIIDGIRDIQIERGGYDWTFTFQTDDGTSVDHKRKLFFPLAYIIGDTKGHNILCGRYGSAVNTVCIARDCDAKLETCDDPSIRCNFLQMTKLQEMSKEELHRLSFRKLQRNAFEGVWFGSQPYGINGCVPAEPLHQINLGILERIVETFFSIISKNLLSILDHNVAFTCTNFYRQSDRSYPDMSSFTSGVSQTTRLTGREKVSRVFCIYVVLLTKDFTDSSIDPKCTSNKVCVMSRKEYNDWVNIFEETLLLTSWIYLERHKKSFFKGGRKSIVAERITRFCNLYKESAARIDGMGLKIVKFHHMFHLWWIIRLYGSLLNVDGSRGESNAIVLTKQPGRKTQMRHAIINLQTATERFKRDLVTKCYNSIHHISSDDDSDSSSSDYDDHENSVPRGSRFQVVFNYNTSKIETKWMSSKMKNKLCMFPPNITTAVFNKLSHYNGGEIGRRILSIEGFTELNIKYPIESTESLQRTSHTIRACPSFRQSRPWFDWAVIKWKIDDGTYTDIEAQILMLLDMKTIKFEANPETLNQRYIGIAQVEHNIIEGDEVAFVHSAEGTRNDTSHSGRESLIANWLKMEDTYQMVDVDSFERPCIVIVDQFESSQTNGKYVPGYSSSIITLIPKHEWSKKFIDYEDRDLCREARRRKDDTVTNPDLKPYEI